VTRKILAIATALLAAPMLLASAAEACISCEYVPEVVKGSQTSTPAKPYVKERARAVVKQRNTRAAKKRSVEPAAKKVETAEPAPVKTQTNNENSTIAGAAEAAVTETATVEPNAVRSESSSIALASTDVAATESVAETAKEAAAKSGDCKKFFPSAGMTLTVPCE